MSDIVGPVLQMDSWMSRLPAELRASPLCQLAIPGSHNSLSYSLRSGAGCPAGPAPDLEAPLTGLLGCAPRLVRPLLARWAVTQQLTARQQLAAGVRYLDVRAALTDGDLHVVHGIHGPQLRPLLTDVRSFVDAHPGELVIVDFQHVYGLDAARFPLLSDLLREVFGERLVPRTELPPTLEDAAAEGCSVLAVYRGPEFPVRADGRCDNGDHLWDNKVLWSPWPDTQSARKLFPLLEHNIDRATRLSPGRLHVHQCVFTPQTNHLILKPASSLRRLAVKCNERTAEWLRGQSCRRGLNIVMTDFVGVKENALIEQIVLKNYEP